LLQQNATSNSRVFHSPERFNNLITTQEFRKRE